MHMSSQTKDEAAQELTKMIHQYANGVATIEEVDTARDAYAQAYADAALEIERNTIIVQEANHDEGQYEEEADTLGMLEAHVGSHFKDEVSYRRFDEEGGNLIVGLMRGEQGELIWWGGHFDRNGRTTVAISSRAEAEALLKGDAE